MAVSFHHQTDMRLYVGNLSFETTENDLRDTFGQSGSVTDVKIINDPATGRSRGFGFVTMGNNTEGEAAIAALDGQDIDGRKLTVNEARPREDRPQRSSRPFSGGGGGGGGYRR